MTSTAHKLVERRVTAYHNVLTAMRFRRYWFFNRCRHHEAMRLMLLARERRRAQGFQHQVGLSNRIIDATADALGILRADILRQGRAKIQVKARWIASWVMYKHTRNSSAEIGRRLGGRDHSTILHGLSTVRADLASGGKRFGAIVAHVERKLGLK